jgi:queuine tRNA-ribosyltransferase
LLNSIESPHEVLRYISEIGIDIFDAHWAQRAADIGVALDFAFPVRSTGTKKDIGHSLYEAQYTLDFAPLADSFRGALSEETTTPICPCAACSPITPATRTYHGADTPDFSREESRDDGVAIYRPHLSRAYIHHLLHTHEMSAHTFLVMHNLAVLEAFLAGVRALISDAPGRWAEEVLKFGERYDESMAVFDRAKLSWKEVELARGKGRLAREKERQEEGTLGTSVEV